MKRTTKIVNITMFKGFNLWKVVFYIDGSYIIEYNRKTRKSARELAKQFVKTGICPRN